MKQWKVTNPRKRIKFAVINKVSDSAYELRYGATQFQKDTHLFITLLAAKMWYGREVQSPKHYERAKWEEVKEQNQ
jgi:hypothetical protein